MKKCFVVLLLIISVFLVSCSGSLFDIVGDSISSLNTNVFVKNTLTSKEKETIESALVVNTLPVKDNYLDTQIRVISTYDGIKVPIKLRYLKQVDNKNISILETIPNDVRNALSVIFNNKAKAAEIKKYLKAQIEGETKDSVDECVNSIILIIENSVRQIDFPDTEDWKVIETAINDMVAEFEEVLGEQFNALTKGDVLAISLLSSTINNIIAKIGAQSFALKDYDKNENEFNVFGFSWESVFASDSDKYFYSLVDSIAEELALMNAILPQCDSFVDFNIKEIAQSFLEGMK